MNTTRWMAVVVALAACRGGKEEATPGSAAGSAAVVSAGSASGSGSTDPWASNTVEDAPSLGERHKFAEAACPKVTGPYFFEIEKDGKTNYILGTRHVSVPLAKFPPVVKQHLLASKLAVFEVAPDDDAHDFDRTVDIAGELGPDLWAHYRDLVGATQADALAHATPGAAVISMMVLYEDVGAMLDKELQDAALQAHIPARGLETAAFQDGLLTELLDERMLRASIKSTKDRAEIEQHSREDLHDYCAGTDDSPGMDPDERKDMIAAGYTAKELDAMDDKLVFARNARWIPKLEQLFAQGDVFVAVGADHLTGDRGVISLLGKRGFHTRRITE